MSENKKLTKVQFDVKMEEAISMLSRCWEVVNLAGVGVQAEIIKNMCQDWHNGKYQGSRLDNPATRDGG